MRDVVAVLASACRFPDADTPERFFDNLSRGLDSVREVPADRWSIARHHDRSGKDPTRAASRWGAFLDDPWAFDAAFFGVEAEEARCTDPQQRLALTVAHEALERAGYAGPRRRALRVGVFVGVGHADHDEVVLRRMAARLPAHPATAVGTLRNLVAARIARALDLVGPALVVDTACSSTLVAVHLARSALLAGECDLALAGGVSVHLTPSAAILLGRGGALSPTGRCRPFSALADGLTLGEGCGMVLLARESEAARRGDPVLARVLGSAVGNDGATLGPMTPRPAGQARVMRAAWSEAGLDPRSASYVEAHGTGTRVGDAVEGQSIVDVFGERPLRVGSAKGNVGHLLAAAGATGLLKVIESLRERAIPPSLHARPLSPKLPFERAGIEVPEALSPWEAEQGTPRRAGLNAFGFGGTNAHVVIEEAPAPRGVVHGGAARVLLSAPSVEALAETARALADRVRATPAEQLPALMHHASFARAPREHRAALVGVGRLAERLDALARGERPEGAWVGVAGEEETPAELPEPERFVRGATPPLPDSEPTFVRPPTFPFARTSYRLAEPERWDGAPREDAGGLMRAVDVRIGAARADGTIEEADPIVADHRVHGRDVIPAAGITEILRAALASSSGRDVCALDEVAFRTSVGVVGTRALRVDVEPGRRGLVATLLGDDGADPLASAREGTGAPERTIPPLPEDARPLAPAELYARIAARGMVHGPYYQALRAVWVRGHEAWADLELPARARDRGGQFGLHPSLLDAALQPVAAVLLEHAGADPGLFVPVRLERVRLAGEIGERARVHVALAGDPARPGDAIRCDATVVAAGGAIDIDGAVLARASAERMHGHAAWLHAVRWAPAPRAPAPPPAAVALHADALLRADLERELAARGVRVDGIAGALLVVAEPAPAGGARLDDALVKGPLMLLGLARALAPGTRVVVVTRGGTAVAPDERVDPIACATFALAHALADEGLAASAVDLAVDASAADIAEAAALELAAPPGVAAYRRGARHERSLAPLETPEPAPLRDEGVYLVTGGARGIGLEIARALAGPRRTVVVTSRGDARVPDGLRHVRCDVTDARAVHELIRSVVVTHGALHGVVHAAGVVRPARLRERTDEVARAVLAPKVQGTMAVLDAIRELGVRPDFVALFSSISAAASGLGGTLADYVCANALMDGLARAAPPELAVRSLAWSNWAETGMGADPALVRRLEERGMPSWTKAEGVRAFHAALAIAAPHVVVARFGRPIRAPVVAAPVGLALADDLRAMVASALGVPPSAVPVEASLSRLGLDSLVAIELAKALEARVGHPLPTTLFFDHDTIEKVAAAILASAPAAATAPAPPGRAFLLPKAFVVQQRLEPALGAFSLVRLRLDAAPAPGRLADALGALAERHPMLRMRIEGRAGEVEIGLDAPARDAIALSRAEPGELDVERHVDGWLAQPFDLERGPLLRVLALGEHLALCAHHAVADAWSMHVLAGELLDLLAGAALPDPVASAVVARAHEVAEASPEDIAFFSTVLSAPADPLGLEAGPARGFRSAHRSGIDARALDARARAAGATPFQLVLSAYALALAAATGARRIAISVARARREGRIPGIERIVGCLADTLPVVLDVAPGTDVEALAAQARDRWRAVEAHATPTSVDLARLPRASGLPALTEASLSFVSLPLAARPGVLEVRGRTATASTGLGLAAYEDHGALVLTLTHASGRVPAWLADEVLARTAAALADGAPRAVLALPDAGRRARAILGAEVSHADLADAASRIAGYLVARGLGAGARVGVLGEPGEPTLAALTGVLRAGATWLALDPDDPPAWQRELTRRAGLGLVLADRETVIDGAAVVSIAQARAAEPLAATPTQGSIAYIATTSGSSGPPKLVPIAREALARYLGALVRELGYRETDRALGLAPLVFDASVRQLLGPLAAGASILTAPRALARDPDAVLDALDAHRITILSTVPSMLARIADAAARRAATGPTLAASLRMIQSGGETLSVRLARRLRQLFPGATIVNVYGPTEATVNVAWHVVDDETLADPEGTGRVPIGRAVAGARLSVRGEDGSAGASEGELWIAGGPLSPGYLDDPERSARSFVERDGALWYRTGDRVRLRGAGTFDLVGRIDEQVKIRGRRVDPGDVEQALSALPEVAAAAVRAERGEDPHLVAWVVPGSGVATDERALRDALRARLPDALVPRRIHLVAELPAGRAGKVDRLALEVAPRAVERVPGAAPPSIEAVVRAAFSEVLGRDDVAEDDDFFACGGDSISALTLFDRLSAQLARELPRPAVLYEARSARALAARIAMAPPARAAGDDARDDEAGLPLSPAQRGFLAARAHGDPIGWSARIPIEGPLDPIALDRALEIVLARHPMLRARFTRGSTGWHAWIDPSIPIAIERGPVGREPFDLSAHAALLRIGLTYRPDGRAEIQVLADHLVGDAISGTLLAAELVLAHDALVRGEVPELPAVGARFGDLAARALAEAAEPARHAHVRRVFAAPYVAPRAYHRSRPLERHRVEVEIAPEIVSRLAARARAANQTVFEALFSAYARACAALSGASDVVIAAALAGRDDPRALRVFGPLVTMMPVRVALRGDPGADATASIEALREGRAHAMPVGEIARALPPGTTPSDATGEAFFVTFVDVDALEARAAIAGATQERGLVLRWDEAEIDGTVPEACDIHLSARRARGALRLTFDASSRAVDREGLRALALGLRAELAGALDTLLVGYLPAPADLARAWPAAAADAEGLRPQVRAAAFPDGSARLFETLDTPLGRAAFVVIPRFADELDAAGLEGEVRAALALGASLGARQASLAGMLPARTGYGRALVPPPGLALTTGHATTAASIVLTIEHALGRVGGPWAGLRVAFVGLGSVGAAAAELAVEVLGAPRAIVLCDLPRAEARTCEIALRLGRAGARDVVLAHATPALPEAALACELIVAASSGGAVVDAHGVRPGTIVLDDSFPPVIDVEAGWSRMRGARDALFAGAGLIDAGTTLRTLALPPALEPSRARVESARPRVGLPSCMLEPLLRLARPELPATLGLVDLPAARAYLAAARSLGLRAAPLHLGAEEIGDEVVAGARDALRARR